MPVPKVAARLSQAAARVAARRSPNHVLIRSFGVPRPRRLAVGGVGGAPPSLLRGLLTKVPRRTELTAQVDGEAWSFPFAGERIEVSLKGRVGVRFGRASHRPMAVAAALM